MNPIIQWNKQKVNPFHRGNCYDNINTVICTYKLDLSLFQEMCPYYHIYSDLQLHYRKGPALYHGILQ